jgi:hypothetical protein
MIVLDENILDNQRQRLRHPDFNTQAKRMGATLRISRAGIIVWRINSAKELHFDWPSNGFTR